MGRERFQRMEAPGGITYTTPLPGPTSDWDDCTVRGEDSQLPRMQLE
jgi:hypothetical protein